METVYRSLANEIKGFPNDRYSTYKKRNGTKTRTGSERWMPDLVADVRAFFVSVVSFLLGM